jgi:hypothetical protein
LVGDMAIANKFYRAKTSEEKQQYAELYKASLQPYPVDVSEYRMPELLIPKQGVAEGIDIGQEWMSDTELDQYVPDRLQQQWRELLGYDRNGNPSALWTNLTGGYEPDVRDPQHRSLMVKVANKWFAAKKIPNVKFYDVKDADDELEWLVQIGSQDMAENFADGRNPGRKGLAKRSGVNTKASVSSLRKTAKNSSGEKQRMAHWLANMKAGRAKARKK